MIEMAILIHSSESIMADVPFTKRAKEYVISMDEFLQALNRKFDQYFSAYKGNTA